MKKLGKETERVLGCRRIVSATVHEALTHIATYSSAFARLTSVKMFDICSKFISHELIITYHALSHAPVLFYYVVATPRARSLFSHWMSSTSQAEQCRGGPLLSAGGGSSQELCSKAPNHVGGDLNMHLPSK